MPAGNVLDQGAHGGLGRRRGQVATQRLRGGEAAGQQAHGGAFDIALHTCHLTRETQAWHGLQPQLFVQKLGTVQIGVAVQTAQARELGVLQAGDHAEDLGLRPVLQLGLEADHVEQGSKRIVLAQLDDGVGLDQRIARIGQADRLHRAVPQGLATTLCHDLDRQAAIEIGDVLPVLELGLGTAQQGVDEGLVLGLVHRAVDVGGGVAARTFLIIPRLTPGDVEVDRIGVNDGGDGVEEAQGLLARRLQDRVGQGGGGQGAGSDDDIVPLLRRQAGDLFAHDRDQGVGGQFGGHRLGEGVAVHGQGAAGGYLIDVAAGHDDRIQRPHLGVQQADRIELPVVRAEGVGADQLGQAVGVVGVGLDAGHAAHLVQDDGHAGLGDLPGGLGAGQAAADDVDGGRRGGSAHRGLLAGGWRGVMAPCYIRRRSSGA